MLVSRKNKQTSTCPRIFLHISTCSQRGGALTILWVESDVTVLFLSFLRVETDDGLHGDVHKSVQSLDTTSGAYFPRGDGGVFAVCSLE